MHDVKMKICQRDSKKDDMTDNDNNDNNDSLFVAHDLNAIVSPETDGRGAPFDRVVVLKNNIDDDLVDDHDDHDLGDEDENDHDKDDDATHVLTGVHDQLSFDGPHPVLLVLKRRQNSNIVSSSPKLASKAAIIPPPPAASSAHLTNSQMLKFTCG